MPIEAIAFELAMFSWKEGTYPESTDMEYLTREISLNSVIFRYKEQDIRVWFLHERYIWSLLYSCSTVRWSFWLILMWVWSFLLKVSWCLQIEPQAPLLVVPVCSQICLRFSHIILKWSTYINHVPIIIEKHHRKQMLTFLTDLEYLPILTQIEPQAPFLVVPQLSSSLVGLRHINGFSIGINILLCTCILSKYFCMK